MRDEARRPARSLRARSEDGEAWEGEREELWKRA